MDDRRPPRERELVLAPNEYAYILDTTKGHINCYVGPNKTSLAQTDELVNFDERTKRFERVQNMQAAIQLFATAPANWYLVLKNPAKGDMHPAPGVSTTAPELRIGTKVNVPGPVSFALYPGQMARILEGHRLRSNQYVVVRIYDADRAASSRAALGLAADAPLVIGDKHIVRGSLTSFFIPPDGIEVVPSEDDKYVRDAVTLQRLEYCVLVGEDGKKHFMRGEAVVFPEPNQRFLERAGRRAFQAIELSDVTGIHVKVIAPYVDIDDETGAERTFNEGEELFLTGNNRVYFPRAEHAIIRTEGHDLHHAVAIPRGEGRYVLNRQTGSVSTMTGPVMFLPDPRSEVIVRRILSDRECRLLFPDNTDVIAVNHALRARAAPAPTTQAPLPRRPREEPTDPGEFVRGAFQAPRTITLDTRYDGVVSLDVWSGYAVQVVDRAGGRRVVKGPATVHLAYDESLEALTLSTGTPKSSDRLLETAYLQLTGNKVSDIIEITTSDLVRAKIAVKYRVNFEGDDTARWFSVDNYVQLLVDHARSIVLAAAQRQSIHALRRDVTQLVRDALLGAKPDGSARRGLPFAENNMRVYDVEVLALQVLDTDVEKVLHAAERRAIDLAVDLSEREAKLARETRRYEIDRALAVAAAETRVQSLELEERLAQLEHAREERQRERMQALLEADRARERLDAELNQSIRRLKLESDLEAHDAQVKRKKELQAIDLERLQAEIAGTVAQAQAWSPQLVATLQRMGDEHFLAAVSKNFGELAAVEGRGVLETARKFLDFIPTSMVPQLKSRNGEHTGGDDV